MDPTDTSLPHKTKPVYVRATAPLPAEENAAQLWTMDRGYLVNKRTAYGIYVIYWRRRERGGCVIPLLRVAYTPSFESAWYKKWYSFQMRRVSKHENFFQKKTDSVIDRLKDGESVIQVQRRPTANAMSQRWDITNGTIHLRNKKELVLTSNVSIQPAVYLHDGGNESLTY